MYNRYAGNTGKFYRVEEPGDVQTPKKKTELPIPEPIPLANEEKRREEPASFFDGMKNPFPKGLSSGVKGLLKSVLPDSIDIGDLLLILVLLLMYLENEDEETLIILGALLFLGSK